MEQVLCQASQRDLGDEDIGQGSAKANKFVYVTIEQGGDQPSTEEMDTMTHAPHQTYETQEVDRTPVHMKDDG